MQTDCSAQSVWVLAKETDFRAKYRQGDACTRIALSSAGGIYVLLAKTLQGDKSWLPLT